MADECVIRDRSLPGRREQSFYPDRSHVLGRTSILGYADMTSVALGAGSDADMFVSGLRIYDAADRRNDHIPRPRQRFVAASDRATLPGKRGAAVLEDQSRVIRPRALVLLGRLKRPSAARENATHVRNANDFLHGQILLRKEYHT